MPVTMFIVGIAFNIAVVVGLFAKYIFFIFASLEPIHFIVSTLLVISLYIGAAVAKYLGID